MIFSDIFNTIIFQPLYNVLIFITSIVPGYDIGIAVVLLTILVKLIILPLSHKSIKTQAKVKILEPKISEIKEKYKNNKQEQSTKIMALYKEHGVNPFSGCVFTIIQIPIIFGLYWVFWKGISNGTINKDILYTFVHAPDIINFNFLGLVNLTERSIFFAVLAGVSQYFQLQLSFPKITQNPKEQKEKSFIDELKKNMSTQAKYILPMVIIFVSLRFSAAVPLYWATSNGFSIIHELFVRKKSKELIKGDTK